MKIEDILLQPFVCSQSKMKCAMSCKRKWFCKYALGLELKTRQVSESADLGKIYHKYQQFGPGKEVEVRAWVRKQQMEIQSQIDRGEDLDGSLSRLVTSLSVATKKSEAMAQIFWESYPQPSYFKTLATELKIETPISFIGLCGNLIYINVEGTIDKLLQIEDSGDIWIRDHKSTGRNLLFLFDGLPWSIQGRLYRILADYYCESNNISGTIKGFILDGILKPGIKLCRTDEKNAKDWKCTPEEAYLRRVKEWYIEKNEKAKNNPETETPSFKSQSIMFNEPLLPMELRRDLSTYYELQFGGNDPKKYNRDESRQACSSFERRCIYMPLCAAPINQWPDIIDAKYTIKPIEEDDGESHVEDVKKQKYLGE